MSVFAILGGFIAANGGPIAVGVLAAQIVGRAIPDDKTGVLGVIRTGAKIVGMYANTDQKRIESKVEANSSILEHAARTGIGAVLGSAATAIQRKPRTPKS